MVHRIAKAPYLLNWYTSSALGLYLVDTVRAGHVALLASPRGVAAALVGRVAAAVRPTGGLASADGRHAPLALPAVDALALVGCGAHAVGAVAARRLVTQGPAPPAHPPGMRLVRIGRVGFGTEERQRMALERRPNVRGAGGAGYDRTERNSRVRCSPLN